MSNVNRGPSLLVSVPPNTAPAAATASPTAVIVLRKGSNSTLLPPAPKASTVEFIPEQQNMIIATTDACAKGLDNLLSQCLDLEHGLS